MTLLSTRPGRTVSRDTRRATRSSGSVRRSRVRSDEVIRRQVDDALSAEQKRLVREEGLTLAQAEARTGPGYRAGLEAAIKEGRYDSSTGEIRERLPSEASGFVPKTVEQAEQLSQQRLTERERKEDVNAFVADVHRASEIKAGVGEPASLAEAKKFRGSLGESRAAEVERAAKKRILAAQFPTGVPEGASAADYVGVAPVEDIGEFGVIDGNLVTTKRFVGGQVFEYDNKTYRGGAAAQGADLHARVAARADLDRYRGVHDARPGSAGSRVAENVSREPGPRRFRQVHSIARR